MINPKRRTFIRIIGEISGELSLRMKTYSEEWIIKLWNEKQTGFIYLYSFGINPDSAAKICTDKTATYLLLKENRIPSVEYELVYPQILNYKGDTSGNWKKIRDFFYKHHRNIVLKPNKGSAGKEVFHVTTETELEQVAAKFLLQNTAIALSPYYEIQNEYRAVLLDDEVLLVFKKQIPKIVGDGKKNVGTLLIEQDFSLENALFLLRKNISMSYIPKSNEVIKLLWKHNLTGGASPEVMSKVSCGLQKLAREARQALGIRFASVDIIETQGKLKIIEINSGVTLVNFAMSSPENYIKAKEIYTKAIEKWFS